MGGDLDGAVNLKCGTAELFPLLLGTRAPRDNFLLFSEYWIFTNKVLGCVGSLFLPLLPWCTEYIAGLSTDVTNRNFFKRIVSLGLAFI